jgi:hypothetical protein
MWNPFAHKILGSFVRASLAALGGYLTAHELATDGEVRGFIEAATPLLVSVGLSVLEKYKARKKLVTALALPAGKTELEVEKVIAKGEAPPVTLPKEAQPRIPGTEDIPRVSEPYQGSGRP